jgi:23S rRNA (cytidine1920-2'-O)/16S rRNA (cytidine1409-2'-O)-methyltransferase
MRADVLLVQRGLAPSRALAQRMIEAGHVYVREGARRIAIAKPSASLVDDVEVEVASNELERYVSRGGLKLEGALERIGLDVNCLLCLDVGQSTGGFTDCLLQRGVTHVVGVDVGRDQLHPKLRADSRVTCHEGVNARSMTKASMTRILESELPYFDLIVADVSFISLTKVCGAWHCLLKPGGKVLSLVKPQFEVGADNLGKGGIVRDESLYPFVEATIREACAGAKLEVIDYFASSIVGGDGNREFFVYAKHDGAQ